MEHLTTEVMKTMEYILSKEQGRKLKFHKFQHIPGGIAGIAFIDDDEGITVKSIPMLKSMMFQKVDEILSKLEKE